MGFNLVFKVLKVKYITNTCLVSQIIREILRDARETIWECLRAAFMWQQSEKGWLRTADECYERTNSRNWLDAVDGKHTKMRKTDNSGSLFFSYKNFLSTVLMALVDAGYCFISIDVRDAGVYGAPLFFGAASQRGLWPPYSWGF
jgi:hypothetical protein